MKLVSFSINDGLIRPGALLDDGNLVLDLSSGFNDTLSVISAGINVLPAGVAYPLLPARRGSPPRAALQPPAHLLHRRQL